MANLSDSLLPRLIGSRLPDLDLGPGAVAPAYDGLSILNLPSSLCRWLRVPELPHPPLAIPALEPMAKGVRQVVVLLIDAVGYDRFVRWTRVPDSPLYPLHQSGLLAPLTSVVPSTTSSALTSLWTGRSPAEHGVLGYELFLKEVGLVANMITLSPAATHDPGGLMRAGFRPEAALPVPTLGTHLSRAEVEAHAFLPHGIRNSGLSRMHLNDVVLHSFHTSSDLWIGVRALVEQPLPHPRLIWAYYPEVDTLSHRYGPDSPEAEGEMTAFAAALRNRFLDSVSAQARRHTLLVILSDHGQLATRKDPIYEIRNHPELTRDLHILPCGESRLSYLYLRPERSEAVAEYFERTWPGTFRILASDQALAAGLFGPGEPASTSRDRIGDRIAVSQGEAYLGWGTENTLVGRHGGLSREEMLVPLLVSRLA